MTTREFGRFPDLPSFDFDSIIAELQQRRRTPFNPLIQEGVQAIEEGQPAPRQPFQPGAPTQPSPVPLFLQNLRSVAQGVEAGPVGLLPFDPSNLGEVLQAPPALKAGATAFRALR